MVGLVHVTGNNSLSSDILRAKSLQSSHVDILISFILIKFLDDGKKIATEHSNLTRCVLANGTGSIQEMNNFPACIYGLLHAYGEDLVSQCVIGQLSECLASWYLSTNHSETVKFNNIVIAKILMLIS